MGSLKSHVRNKFVAGLLAAIPVAVTFFILWYVDSKARSILGIEIPFLGIVVALGAIYVLGLFVTSGHTVEGDPETSCVFIPASPNPTSGRLHFIPKTRCLRVDLARQEAIKM